MFLKLDQDPLWESSWIQIQKKWMRIHSPVFIYTKMCVSTLFSSLSSRSNRSITTTEERLNRETIYQCCQSRSVIGQLRLRALAEALDVKESFRIFSNFWHKPRVPVLLIWFSQDLENMVKSNKKPNEKF